MDFTVTCDIALEDTCGKEFNVSFDADDMF